MIIRPYEINDLEAVREVSVNTGGHPGTEKDKKVLWLLFLDYYIEQEPDCCFVAADENSRAQGFVIASADYEAYEKVYRKKYLKPLSKLKFTYGIYKRAVMRLEKKYGLKYRAHLHIDINPDFQRMGLGHKLMDALILRLNEKGVPTVYLIVGGKNEKGINFYRKYGFTEAGRVFNGIVYVLYVKDKAAKINAAGNK